MRLITTFRMALRALRRNTMRSILTALGIIIGVGAVIAMVSIGNGAKQQVKSSIASLGENLIMVTPGNLNQGAVRSGLGGATTLTTDDADAIVDELVKTGNGVIGVSPETSSKAQILANGQNWSTTIKGESPDYPLIRSWRIGEGVFFSDTDVGTFAKVAVIGKTIVDQLFPDGDPIGQSLRIGNVPFRVIGVMAEKGYNANSQDQDDVVFVPYTSYLKRLARRPYISQIFIQAANEDVIDKVQTDVTDLLTQRRKGRDPDFTVRNQEEIAAAQTAATDTMTYLLGAIAGVSLLVGGIGIMNIMLVSVTERTREIGIRMAVGAHGSDVLTQFLIEAISLSSLGGMIGVCLGIGGSELLGKYKGWAVEPSTASIVIAVAFSAAVGVFFGYYPARKAAQLDPIDALRYE
jgi:putative ABC transport system permease protein